jgi:hypothetical protein
MNEAIICRLNKAKTLALTEAVCRELRNFLIYRHNPEILNERARHQPKSLHLEKIPADVREIGELLGADKCERNRKLFLDCSRSETLRSVLIHNVNAQFWVYYFRCGIGLVNLSFFGYAESAESSIPPSGIRTVADSYDFQWFAHALPVKYFKTSKRTKSVKNLGKYFVERVNPTLVNPHSIFYENRLHKEPCKFVSGSLEKLKQVMTLAFLVCEQAKREKAAAGEKIWFSPHATVYCGNLRCVPKIEHGSEWFINEIGALALKENAPYTVLDEGYGRRVGGESFDWTRKKRHYIHFNFQDEIKTAAPRAKIAARFHLVEWLRKQGAEGNRVIKTWNLDRADNGVAETAFSCPALSSNLSASLKKTSALG